MKRKNTICIDTANKKNVCMSVTRNKANDYTVNWLQIDSIFYTKSEIGTRSKILLSIFDKAVNLEQYFADVEANVYY